MAYEKDESNLRDSYFENNVARGGDGGAIYINCGTSERPIINCYFLKNHAAEDGGAIYSYGDTILKNSTFESNRASGAKLARSFGGAIRSKNSVKVDNCTFKDNFAVDYGGAIYADTIKWVNSYSYFIGNAVGDNSGGAIYTNKFTNDVKYGIFINNNVRSNDEGGAIYINKENRITFSQCVFVNNHCGNKGGAIYLDSSSSHLTLVNNIFASNSAKEGDTVYNCGKYDSIKDNWWGGKNPSSDNDQLVEWKMWPWSNIHHTDSNPLKFTLKLSATTANANALLCATAGFYNNNGKLSSGEMITDYISFMPVLDIVYSNRTDNKANVTTLISPQKEAQYTITANLFGQLASNTFQYSEEYDTGDAITIFPNDEEPFDLPNDEYEVPFDSPNEVHELPFDSLDSSNALNAPVNNEYDVDGYINNGNAILFGVISNVENTNHANSSNETPNNGSVAKTIDNQSNGSSFNYLWILLLIVIFAGAGVLIKQYKN